jgi:23S rRNA pseudouridine2604 synthase
VKELAELKKQIRRMCEALGYRVTKLKRVRIMNVHLKDLKTGEYRPLTEKELANQKITTYEQQKLAEDKRLEMEASRGRAEMQKELAQSQVSVDIERNNSQKVTITASAMKHKRIAEAEGSNVYNGFD